MLPNIKRKERKAKGLQMLNLTMNIWNRPKITTLILPSSLFNHVEVHCEYQYLLRVDKNLIELLPFSKSSDDFRCCSSFNVYLKSHVAIHGLQSDPVVKKSVTNPYTFPNQAHGIRRNSNRIILISPLRGLLVPHYIPVYLRPTSSPTNSSYFGSRPALRAQAIQMRWAFP